MKIKEYAPKAEEWKQNTVVRTDLDMGAGKIAAQCQHAQSMINIKPPHQGTVARIVTRVGSQRDLTELMKLAQDNAIAIHPVWDAGRTQVPAGTLTCIAFGPAPKERMDRVFGHLKLL